MKDGVSGSSPDIGSAIILKFNNMGMESLGNPLDKVLEGLYSKLEGLESMKERLEVELEIVDIYIQMEMPKNEIRSSLGDLLISAEQEGLNELVEKIKSKMIFLE